jgi:ferredoxin-NADP reductase
MHAQLAEGDILQISPPNNLFALHATSGRQILIAGGIGITPFMSQMEELQASGAAFELHYAFRSREQAALLTSWRHVTVRTAIFMMLPRASCAMSRACWHNWVSRTTSMFAGRIAD